MTIRSQKNLEIELSKLKNFENPSLELEQYATPSHIAAEWVWTMAMKKEVAGKTILDAACGPGILGIGLLLMGAKKVYFVDKDEKAMQLCISNYNQVKEEYEIGEAAFIVHDISLFDGDVDIVVQNPPFGTKEEHADKRFLEKAFSVAPIVYSMHKWSTQKFVDAIARDYKFVITDTWRFEFPIKAAFSFHQKPKVMIDVGLWRIEKKM
ncbi:MAG: METTL5 family protein [Nanoarchaeota archaeon]|nr:METTL5 family protein [Nanoarchaeota archaeon]